MCLHFDNCSIETTKRLKKNRKWLTVWKIYHRCGSSVYSPYESFKLKLEPRTASSRSATEVTDDEYLTHTIHRGFHFYTDYERACLFQHEEHDRGFKTLLIETKISTSDLVMVGYDDDRKESLVATHLSFTKKRIQELRKQYPELDF